MGLSMDERRALEEIERQLTADDPRFATRLQAPQRVGMRAGTQARPQAGLRDEYPWMVAPQRPGAVASWNAIALAVILFLLAGVVHVALLTGVGLVLLLVGLAGVTRGRRKRGEEPTRR